MNRKRNTLTYVDPSSQRPILKNIYDKGAQRATDENVNFIEILETLSDLASVTEAMVFVHALEGEHPRFMTLLKQAQNLMGSVKNLEELLLILSQMYHLAKGLPPSVSTSFVVTQLRPFLKEERYKD